MMIFKNILTNILSGLYTGFFESLLLAFFFMFFYLTAKKEGGFKVAIQGLFTKFKASKDLRRIFYFVFYLFMILSRTILGRSLWINPLNNVIGTWSLHDVDGNIFTEGIENLILFIPLMYLYFVMKQNQSFSFFSLIKKSVKISFLFSLGIEFTQLFLKLGSFQLSDLVYNTLGGLIGGLIYALFHAKSFKKESDPS